MKNFLRVAALAICAILMTANASAQGTYDQATMGAKVVEMETASWGQNSPFNNYCWSEYGGSTHAKAGCVPVAFAIVMRYHGFPAEGTSSTLYNCQASTYVEVTDRTYDWEKMPLTNGSGWTTEQQNEVAKLISHLGHAFGVSYGVSQTSVSIGDSQTERLTKYFNYKAASATSQYPSNNNLENWKQKIKESLNNGCPVPYAANNTGTGDSRHMFVIDGYTSNDYFHFNFGWNGSGNGWFKLDNITPAQGDNYSWSDDGDGYTSKHQAFFNLMPNKTPRTVTATTNSSSMGTVSINGGTAGNSVSAEVTEGTKATLTAHPADGYALASWTKNGVIVGTKSPIQVTVGESGNDYVANFDDAANVQIEKTCTFNISNVTTSGVNEKYCSTWTTSDGIVLSCSKGSEPAYALSTTVNTFFAKAGLASTPETLVSDITYTLTAPEGFVIKSYSFKGKSPSSSYTIDVTVGGNTTNVTNASAGVVISTSDINSKSTSFVLGSTYTGRAGLSIMEDGVTVTIVSEGGASTPTPDPEPEPEPTPTTYNITAEASPQNAGKVAINGGAQSTIANIDVTSGSTVSLQAYPNSGYEFAGWYNGTTKVSNNNPYSITATADVSYIASFQEVQQGGSSSNDLAGRYFRLKTTVNSAAKYLNVADNNTHTAGAYGGVNVATLDESSNAQIFYFEASGDGYKLKDKNGYYIKGQEWNVDANSTVAANGSVLLFEETDNINEYYIKWNNTTKGGIRYFKVGLGQNTSNYYPYGDEANKASAAVWVLEEVIPSNEKTLNVTYSGATWNNEASGWWVSVVTNTTPAITVKTTDGTAKIGYSTFNGIRHPYLLDGNSFTISVPANCKIKGYRLGYKAHNLVSKTVTYTNGKQSTGTLTIAQSDEENTLTVTELDNSEIAISVADQSSQAGFIIKSLEITYVENEFTPLPFKAEIEGWRNDNPNTHLGTITIGGTAMKLTPAHQTASELTMPLAEGTALAFTRKYRGFEFNGFYIGSTSLGENPTLTAEHVAAINETTPLVAKFKATDDVTLFYDDDQYSYRIPAIAKTGNGMLVAVSDYRHNLDDIGRDNHGTGTKRIDLVMRTSTDNGATWSETKTIAAGDNSKAGSYLRAFGDAAIAAVGQNIVVMAAAGDVVYTAGTTSSPNKMARIYSTDNGATWTIEEMTTKMYSQSTSLIPSGGSAFFGSGKLAVDPNFNGTGNARIYGALLVRIGTDGYNNFGVFSDDLGATWKILGGDNTNPVAKGDEPKVEILPNGQILLSARRGGGRVFRIFTYGDDKANGAGSWGDAAVNGCDNGGSNATNGEIICLDAKKPNGKPTKILLQSQPKGGSGQYDRYNVTIWYKEVSANETYTAAEIASGWTQGLEVSPADVKSAYSAMCLQENGKIAFFFEEAPCYGDDHTKGYSMVYVPLTIEEITENNFLNPNADVEYVPTEFSIVLTDTLGNEYRETLDYIPNNVAAVESYLTTTYPFITLGNVGAIADNKYANTVTLPFKVSNAENAYWHNIYWPANGTSAGEFYPIYMMANTDNATNVAKITEKVHYGNSQYNTLAYADKLSWAVYSVNNTLTFKFKNKLTGNFMAVNGVVSSGNENNVIYTDEANATAFTLTKNPGTNNNWKGDYAITSVYNSTTGYVCNTSANYANATNYASYTHPGAWAKFVEAPDYAALIEEVKAALAKFGDAAGQYTPNSEDKNDIDAARTAMDNSGSLVLNELNGYKALATEALARATENYTLYVTSAGYATMYLGYPAAIPAGVEAYTVTSVSESHAALTPVTGVLPANTGIIVKAAEGNYTFAYSKETPATVAGNLLEGTVDATEINVEAYVLGIVDGEVGLYKAKMTDGKWLNNANKAYLPASAVPNKTVAFYGFDWDGTTGVEKVEIRNEKEEIYDLCGRRIESITSPGIYIVNGRKVLVK
ncbi:MAG: C10 family peptidase [Bacteroidaceae bacterium]|nr:C10 family peptidase [Bacteroidaceae bacterium]